MNILGLSGSLRRDSSSTALLHAAGELLPDGATLAIHALDDVPLYNGDLEADPPGPVTALGAAVAAADAVILSTPEYNHSISAVTKNALDWLSRPPGGRALANKPVVVLSQSPGPVGGARMQLHLREVLSALGARQLPRKEFAMGLAGSRFDADGRLTDDDTRERLGSLLATFTDFAAPEAP